MNDKTFKNFKLNSNNKEAFNKSKEFLSNSRGLFLFGSVGSGKTHLAKAAYNELKEKHDCRFISMPELLLEIRETFNNKGSEKAIIDYYTDEREYLFLDDFGAEKIGDFSLRTIYLILSRWERKLELIDKSKIFITSNYDLDKVSSEMIDKKSNDIVAPDRVASRIVGTCETCRLDDKDWRVEK